MSDPIPVVARLRNLAVEEAKRALADCLSAEASAAEALRALEDAIGAETDAAADLSGDDRSVEDFSTWLRHANADRVAAQATLTAAETRSAESRAVLAASRSAAKAMESLLAQREAERQAATARREQVALDEAGQRPKDDMATRGEGV
jgi:flagellar export protein FliJ